MTEGDEHLDGLDRTLVGLEAFLAFGAFGGGAALIGSPAGEALRMPVSMLDGTPFSDWRIPGLLLVGINGVLPSVVAAGTMMRRPWAQRGHVVVGAALSGWILGQVAMIGGWHPLQIGYFGMGAAITGLALGNLLRPRARVQHV
jgi:urea transporter